MNKKIQKIPVISDKHKSIQHFESTREYMGKKVISKSGDKAGSIKDVLFTDTGIKGMVVRKRFLKFYVDKSFFNTIADNAMLSIDPVLLLAGKEVFDADGKKLGKVKKVIRKGNSNNLDKIIVKKRIYSKGIEIPHSDIEVLKKNIILNKTY
jgi:sporulation protein YlmC with PRC-barrel domain